MGASAKGRGIRAVQQPMASVEESVKKHFARVFVAKDWSLFKKMAEFYLRRAAFLRTNDVDVEQNLKLLVRNAHKRLFIGVGSELLLKAIYLKHGFAINKTPSGAQPTLKFPFTFPQIGNTQLLADKTYMLDDLINHLNKVLSLQNLGGVLKGLKIAKVFRNKEGHTVVSKHAFDHSNYRDIENTLIALYAAAFNEGLKVRLSVSPGEKAGWDSVRRNAVVAPTLRKRRIAHL